MLAFTKIGLMPDGGASALVAAAVGRIRAMRMALLAERDPADEAFAGGLVTAVHPADELEAEVDKVIATLVSRAGRRAAKTKHAINAATLTELEGGSGARTRRPGRRCCGARTSARASRPSRSVARPTSPTRRDDYRRPNQRLGVIVRVRVAISSISANRKIVGRDRVRSATIDGVSTQFDIEKPVAYAGRLARARTIPVPRIPPADRRGVAVDLRRRHVDRRDGAAGHRARQRSRCRCRWSRPAWASAFVAFLLVGGIAADRVNQRTIIIAVETVNVPPSIGDRGARDWLARCEIWHMAVAAAALGIARGVLLPGLQRDPAEDPACRTTAGGQRRRGRGAPGLPAGGRSRSRRASWWARRSRRWVPSRWRRCSPSVWCCWWRPGPQ